MLRPGVTPRTVEIDLKVQDQLPFHGNVGRCHVSLNEEWRA